MLLLSSSAPEGVAFIQTSSLDGEKTLKKRVLPKGLAEHLPPTNVASYQVPYASVTSEAPSKELYSYKGKLVCGGKTYALTA